jgi:hypothetical protein
MCSRPATSVVDDVEEVDNYTNHDLVAQALGEA